MQLLQSNQWSSRLACFSPVRASTIQVEKVSISFSHVQCHKTLFITDQSDDLSILLTNGLRRYINCASSIQKGFLCVFTSVHSNNAPWTVVFVHSQHFCHTQLPIQHDLCVLPDTFEFFTASRRSLRFPLKKFNGHSLHVSNGGILGFYLYMLRQKCSTCLTKNLEIVLFFKFLFLPWHLSTSFFWIFFIAQ